MTRPILMGIAMLCLGMVLIVSADDAEKRVKTIYDNDGRPVNQATDAKGWHQVVGTATLAGGQATVTLNTSTTDGKQDVSFRDSTSYRGSAWSLDTSNTRTYTVFPLSGTRFLIKSSDAADTRTVRYRAEGE